MKRVLFVCMGNICRSPAGEGVLRHLVAQRGLEDLIEVDSAGTLTYHAGEPADPRMRSAAARRGYRLDSVARRVRADDFERFDLVLAMDRENLEDLRQVADARPGQLRLLTELLPRGEHGADVPDPYYGGPQGFEVVLDMVEQACPRILEHLLAGLEESSREGPPGA